MTIQQRVKTHSESTNYFWPLQNHLKLHVFLEDVINFKLEPLFIAAIEIGNIFAEKHEEFALVFIEVEG